MSKEKEKEKSKGYANDSDPDIPEEIDPNYMERREAVHFTIKGYDVNHTNHDDYVRYVNEITILLDSNDGSLTQKKREEVKTMTKHQIDLEES